MGNSTIIKVDLYRDVFHFSSDDISDREILMAYLRKGRDIFKETDEIFGTTTTTTYHENNSSSSSSSSNSNSSCSSNKQKKKKKMKRDSNNNNNNKKQRVDPNTRLQFLALSMAYEILSTPSLKEIYLQQGGLSKKKNSKNSVLKKKKKATTMTTTIGTPPMMDSSSWSATTTRAMNLLTSQENKKVGRIGEQEGNSICRPYSTALRKSSFK